MCIRERKTFSMSIQSARATYFDNVPQILFVVTSLLRSRAEGFDSYMELKIEIYSKFNVTS